MTRSLPAISAILVSSLALTLASCGPTTLPTDQASPTPTTSPSPTASPTDQPPTNTVSVTIFRVNDNCDLTSEQVPVDAARPMDDAIAKVIETTNSADFTVTGYRVSVADGVATIDLRSDPEALRSFQSLSSCEKTALFGGLQKTLTSNADWNINEVRFTEKGEELLF